MDFEGEEYYPCDNITEIIASLTQEIEQSEKLLQQLQEKKPYQIADVENHLKYERALIQTIAELKELLKGAK